MLLTGEVLVQHLGFAAYSDAIHHDIDSVLWMFLYTEVSSCVE